MPPKRGSGRGRGARGHGIRGSSSGPAPDPTPPINEESTPASSPPEGITTPRQPPQDDAMDVDGDLSPATQPTETPAPTPIRPAPILPPPSIASGTAASSTKKPSKFQPKNRRRDSVGRQQLEDAERRRLKGLDKEAANAARRSNAIRARGGRGDAMGRGRVFTSGPASGPFAEAPTSEKGKPALRPAFGASSSQGGRGGRGGGMGGTSTSTTRVKIEGITVLRGEGAGSGGQSPQESGVDEPPKEPSYPDDDDTPRIDIEKINEADSSDDEPVITGSRFRGKGKFVYNSNKGGIRPVRVVRREHKDRVSQIDDDLIIKVEADVKDDPHVVVVDDTRSSAAVTGGQKDSGVRVKLEPGEEAPNQEESPPFADFKRPLTELEEETLQNIEVDKALLNNEAAPPVPVAARKVKQRRSSTKDKKPILQTAEDREEYDRHVEDMRVLKDELANMQYAPKASARDVDGNVEMEEGVPDKPDKLEGRLYLFQFPPVLPKLYDPLTQEKPSTSHLVEVKKDNDGKDVEMTNSTNKTPIDLTKGKGKGKESEEIILKQEDIKSDKVKKEREKYVDQEGYIGKLIVRESGRVELDWGGTRMLVGRGIPTGFLTTGILVDPMNEAKQKADENWAIRMEGGGSAFGSSGIQPVHEGKATGMGEIMGKFVVTPDWESMM